MSKMEQDIVPSLLELIQKEFDQQTYSSKKLKTAFQLLKNKKATYLDVNSFAVEVGEILANVLNSQINVGILPDGKMYFNIADRVLNSTMQKNHELISNFAVDVQTVLNHEAGLKIKGQIPAINQDRIDGIINRISSGEDFESVKWLLDDPVINYSQSIVDDAIKANAEFHAKLGLQPEITRRAEARACEWCRNLEGTYDYYDAPDDIYRRHVRCHCTVDYDPGDRRKQDVWSKVWRDPDKEAKIAQRKVLNLKERG